MALLNHAARKYTTAVMGVVYPGVEAYLDDYLSSISGQSDKNFDLVLFNDHFPGLSSFLSRYSNLPVVEIAMPEGTISTKRCWALRKVQALGYKNVVFTDCDDFFSPERVKDSVAALERSGIAFNDFVQVDHAKKELFRSVFFNRKISDRNVKGLSNLNFLGFSNTAARISDVRIPEFPPDLVAVDWFFFSVLVFGQGISLSFIPKPLSYYRCYGNNFGFRMKVTPEYLQKVSDVKLGHYRALLKQPGLQEHFLESVKGSYDRLQKMNSEKRTSSSFERSPARNGVGNVFIEAAKRINEENEKILLWWEALP